MTTQIPGVMHESVLAGQRVVIDVESGAVRCSDSDHPLPAVSPPAQHPEQAAADAEALEECARWLYRMVALPTTAERTVAAHHFLTALGERYDDEPGGGLFATLGRWLGGPPASEYPSESLARS